MIHTPGFLSAAEASTLLAVARQSLAWEARSVRIFGKTIPQPRLVALAGRAYGYSGLALPGAAIPAWLAPVVDRVSACSGERFTSVLFNRYRDGRDSIGWHADDEPELGPDPLVVSLSLGSPRRFLTRPRGGAATAITLGQGDLLIMPRGFQRTHQHAVPKTSADTAERVSLTFRRIDK